MLNLALVGLLAGSLVSGTPDGDRDKDRNKAATPDAPAAEAVTPEAAPALPLGLGVASEEEPRSIIQDTYAHGRAAAASPLRLWASFGYGEVDRGYALDGDEVDIDLGPSQGLPAGIVVGDISSQRVHVGAEFGLPVALFGFGIGVGGQLNLASNKFMPGDTAPAIVTERSSGFGLQGAKAYGTARAGVVGVHAGYHFDLVGGDESGDTAFPRSDDRDAFFAGADFDYPSEVVRLFAGVDYYNLSAPEGVDDDEDGGGENGDILFWTLGGGLRLSVFEVGAALHLQARLGQGPQGFAPFGSHIGSVAPYIKIAPPSLPVSVFVRGSVTDEYTPYGYGLGGANEFKPLIGFTAGLTVGFQ